MSRLLGRPARGPEDAVALMLARARWRIVLESLGLPQERIDEMVVHSPDADWFRVVEDDEPSDPYRP